MVRSTTTTRRTRTDVESLAAIVSGETFADTHDRRDRLVAHGWLQTSGDGAYATTDAGRKVGAIASGLIDRHDFDDVVDIMGLPAFIDACADVDAVDAEAYFAGIRVVDAYVSDVVATTGYADKVDDYDPTPTYAFDARRGRVEVGFRDDTTASNFEAAAPDRYGVERKRDDRFSSGRNPRRFVVDVDA